MKKLFTLSLTLIGVYFFFNYKAVTHSVKPNTGLTGAPGENNCRMCHTGAPVNSGTGSISFSFPDSVWTPDSTYTLNVAVNNTNQSRFGFEMTAINNSGNGAGDFLVTNSNNTALDVSGTKKYISHKNAGSNNSWSFDWTAPSISSTDTVITFYIAGNASNNNFNTAGDSIYTTSVDVLMAAGAPDTTSDSTINDTTNHLLAVEKVKISLFPNPTTDIIHVAMSNNRVSKANIYNQNGQIVKSVVFIENSKLQTIDVNELKSGSYHINVHSNYQKVGSASFIKE